MADTLRRLETEVLGRVICTGPRRCRLAVGEPFDLANYLPEYEVDKRTAMRSATSRLESDVAALLSGMVVGSTEDRPDPRFVS